MKKVLKSVGLIVLAFALTACGSVSSVRTENTKYKALSPEDAKTEISSLLTEVEVTTVTNPTLDIYMDTEGEKLALADISTFDLPVQGTGQINIEIAAATELSQSAPDDWINIVAQNFNREKFAINGKTVSVSVRAINSGEVVTYVDAGAYEPNVFIPSNYIWGKMLETSGVGIEKLTDRIAGNTAGILMKEDVYKTFIDKYKDATISNILKAANAGDIVFAYTNPYTSSTGINALTAMLKEFDSKDPLSTKASEALLEYQKNSPPVAYNTSVLRNQAAKGLVDVMVMEEQSYINTSELRNYKFIPFGVRHDHPVYTFAWNTEEQNEAAKMFVEYCMSDKNQKLATDKGFNRNDNYKSQDSGLTGTEYFTAQSIWKQNKNGGKPIVAVFIADTSGSMSGEPLATLQDSLINTIPYINDGHYVGLVSYESNVTINLPIKQFDNKHRAYFAGEVKNMVATGGTNTYDAVLVALDMLEQKMNEVPDATPLIFLLTDGERTGGYQLSRIAPIVLGMEVPVYSIAYNYANMNELIELSNLNEAASIRADSYDIVNHLRNLFSTQL